MSKIISMKVHVLEARSKLCFVIPVSIICHHEAIQNRRKTKVVHLYLETKSVVATQRKFRRFFKTRKATSRSVILSLVETFLQGW